MSPSATHAAALALSSFLDGRGDVDLSRVDDFYKLHPEHKTAVRSACKDQLKGVRALVASHPDLLGARRVGKSHVLFAVSDSTDDLSMLLARASFFNAKHGEDALPRIEAALEGMREDMPSMAKFKREVQERGICLKDASEQGNKLRTYLSKKGHTVDKERAKQFPLAKKCLVRCG